MTTTTTFRMYGENAATFLIFQALVRKNAIEKVLLRNLRRFGSGKTNFESLNSDKVDVWLFPNFGKGKGFGEPDALILAGDNVLWFEVETKVDFQRAATSVTDSLRQLWRFRFLQAALADWNGLPYVEGQTVGDNWRLRPAMVSLKGHRVLRETLRRLQAAGVNGKDHYVLFSINKPRGPGKAERYKAALKHETEQLVAKLTTDSRQNLKSEEHLPLGRCWYIYAKGDLEPKFTKHCDEPLDLDGHYVPKKGR